MKKRKKMKTSKTSITELFGYSFSKSFHGPLELIFTFINVYDIFDSISLVCKDFYLASLASLCYRNSDIEKFFDIITPTIFLNIYKRNKFKGSNYFLDIYSNLTFLNMYFNRVCHDGYLEIVKLLKKSK